MARAIRSVTAQSVHYLARPHSGVPAGPVGGPAAWTVADVADPASWTYTLTAADIAAIGDALATTDGRVALDVLEGRAAGWREVLANGRGFLRIRGVPVDVWSVSDVERFFVALGDLLGFPGAQNDAGDLLGHVRDERTPPDQVVRQYKTAEAIHFHCDAADVVGLLCLQTAREGGTSRIASSAAVVDRLLAEDPAAAATLFGPWYLDTRGDGGVDAVPVRACAHHRGRLRTFYHSGYFRSAARHAGIPPLTETQVAVLDRFDALAASPGLCLEMDFAPGDIQLISNHTVVHSRAAYLDHEDPAQRRHLLRLWLTIAPRGGLVERTLRAAAAVRLGMGVLAARRRVRRRG